MEAHIRILLILIILLLSCRKNAGESVRNYPPFIERAEIIPSRIYKNKTASCRVFGKDNDKDNITYKYKWFVNDQEYLEESEIELKPFSKGDKIFVEITPYDGKEYGKPYRTMEKYIQNSKPQMRSARIEPDTITSNVKEIKIIGNGDDIDGDNLTYTCEWFLNNKKLDETGTILRENFKKNDVINFIIRANDGEETSENFVSASIYVKNAPPYFQMREDSVKISSNSFNFKINAIDPDGDKIKYSIVSSTLPLTIDENLGVVSGQIPEGFSNITIQVKAEDGEGGFTLKTINLGIR